MDEITALEVVNLLCDIRSHVGVQGNAELVKRITSAVSDLRAGQPPTGEAEFEEWWEGLGVGNEVNDKRFAKQGWLARGGVP